MGFSASCGALQNTVLSSRHSVHSGLLVVIEGNIHPSIRDLLSGLKIAYEDSVLSDGLRE